MHKKDAVKTKKHEDKVENLYGVHFDYKDLFSRLVKVQKQRQMSDDRISMKKSPSIDAKLHHTARVKKDVFIRKRSSSGSSVKMNKPSESIKKIMMRFPVIDMKNEIFKSFSPNRKKRKKLTKTLQKRTEKKSESVLRIIRKSPSKLK